MLLLSAQIPWMRTCRCAIHTTISFKTICFCLIVKNYFWFYEILIINSWFYIHFYKKAAEYKRHQYRMREIFNKLILFDFQWKKQQISRDPLNSFRNTIFNLESFDGFRKSSMSAKWPINWKKVITNSKLKKGRKHDVSVWVQWHIETKEVEWCAQLIQLINV